MSNSVHTKINEQKNNIKDSLLTLFHQIFILINTCLYLLTVIVSLLFYFISREMTQEYMAGHMIHLKGEKNPILQCMPSDAKDNHNKSHTICSISGKK